jgi:hypothetical protein
MHARALRSAAMPRRPRKKDAAAAPLAKRRWRDTTPLERKEAARAAARARWAKKTPPAAAPPVGTPPRRAH